MISSSAPSGKSEYDAISSNPYCTILLRIVRVETQKSGPNQKEKNAVLIRTQADFLL